MTRQTPELNIDPRAVKVRKRPATVSVAFADTDGMLSTLEGKVAYRTGDAILTGVEGEHWPVRLPVFLASYSPAAALPGQPGTYFKKPMDVLALQLTEELVVVVGWQDDLLHGNPGDWLLQYGPGDYGIVTPLIFAQTYEFR